HKLSWANWSGSKIPEGSAAFSSGASPTNLQFSTSGNMVKDYLSSNPSSYTTCPDKVSTEAKLPSSEMKITAVSEGIRLSTNQSGLVEIDVFDMLGQSVFSAKEYYNQGSYILPLEKINAGNYLVKAKIGNKTKTITFQKR
ncbi:MAG TPA: T9SS type A sorting domain-containing protein, partial [Fibrobacteraceae bacterium]|nr:T9SS type A sorting domain-containing protein [Fibrobacteraceae bacterium]